MFQVRVQENKPPGTVIASLRAVDPDAGKNGEVVFSIVKEDLRLPRVMTGRQTPDQPTGRYPEAKVDDSLSQVIIRSDINSVDLFSVCIFTCELLMEYDSAFSF